MSNTKLQNWVANLRQKSMPVLGTVIAEINRVTELDESDANSLAEIILRDPNLTSHVLRVANSVQYNYSEQKVNTISRAIVLIGLKGVRAICISLLIIDRLLSDTPKEQVLALIAQGFHAATQAQGLLGSDCSAEREEVFIAGLLFNLGEMAFWTTDVSPELSAVLTGDDIAVKKGAIEQVIGGSFKSLTSELGKHWQLGETLQQSLFPKGKLDPLVQAVVSGERISRAARYGWQSPQVRKVLEEIAKDKGMDMDEALAHVKKGADNAAQVAASFGAADACPYIPSTMKVDDIRAIPVRSKIMKPDSQVQLNILRELSTAACDKANINALFQMVLEGMHRGVGLERVTVAFVDRRKTVSKYALGDDTDHWRDAFRFDIGPYSENVFTYACEQTDAVWLKPEDKQHRDLYTETSVRLLGRNECLIFALQVGGQPKVLFYADRHNYGGKIDHEQFESFRHFAIQAQMHLNTLSGSAAR